MDTKVHADERFERRYEMKKTILAIAVVVVTCAALAATEKKTFRDAQGRIQGTKK